MSNDKDYGQHRRHEARRYERPGQGRWEYERADEEQWIYDDFEIEGHFEAGVSSDLGEQMNNPTDEEVTTRGGASQVDESRMNPGLGGWFGKKAQDEEELAREEEEKKRNG